MNIKRAKQEIRDTLEAYLLKDEEGNYLLPQVHQRPILLLGAPGIGKTQIVEQAAREAGVALVAYTITHHTRQSAIGLPFIEEKLYGEDKYHVTEYTMSEIVAAVYQKMEETGLKEGILFLDEINCVSETLAPAMLQFLQCKTFGNHRIPEGWLIVAAGNPPEYNRSVREFDVVTLDRIKRIDVQPEFDCWKEFAYKQGVHQAVISYLTARTGYFYKMENTVDGRFFATPRGWCDLAELLAVYERLGKKPDRVTVASYIQHPEIARDFSAYLALYEKYEREYSAEEILSGSISEGLLTRLSRASFDETISVVSFLLARLGQEWKWIYRKEQSMIPAFNELKQQKQAGLEGTETYQSKKAAFLGDKQQLEERQRNCAEMLEHAFDFMEAAFPGRQEMVIFLTEMNLNSNCVAFLQKYNCERYHRYNRELLLDGEEREILREIMDL
ncbi:MAG: MoxR family ATPase [Lachnospiraceae bacterium]|nr:MoxR family ATPase [Lachnospiraceae bacterium]